MARLYANNAEATLASGITSGATSLTLATGKGALFPNPTAPDYFTLTLTQAATESSWEEVKVTARSGDVLTIERGQEGTTAAAWSAGDKAEIRWTALAAQNAANVADVGQAVLDFGAAPGGNLASVTISGQTDIKSTSLVDAWIMNVASADHNAYEHMIVPMTVRCGNVVPGVSFDITGFSEIQLTGMWAIQWIRTK